MTFVSVVLFEFFKAYNFRSDRNSVFMQPFANKWLNLAVAWELMLLGLIVYLPSCTRVQDLQPPWWDLAIIAALAFTVVPVLETAKWMERKGWFGSMA